MGGGEERRGASPPPPLRRDSNPRGPLGRPPRTSQIQRNSAAPVSSRVPLFSVTRVRGGPAAASRARCKARVSSVNPSANSGPRTGCGFRTPSGGARGPWAARADGGLFCDSRGPFPMQPLYRPEHTSLHKPECTARPAARGPRGPSLGDACGPSRALPGPAVGGPRRPAGRGLLPPLGSVCSADLRIATKISLIVTSNFRASILH